MLLLVGAEFETTEGGLWGVNSGEIGDGGALELGLEALSEFEFAFLASDKVVLLPVGTLRGKKIPVRHLMAFAFFTFQVLHTPLHLTLVIAQVIRRYFA